MAKPLQIVVTGANRGLGLEIVRQLLARGEHVIATTRTGVIAPDSPLAALAQDRLRVHACDVGQPETIAAFAQAIVAQPLGGLINNAGVWGDAQSVDNLDFAEARAMYQINALAPLQLSLALRPALARSKGKILHITSGLASISDNTSGGNYGYRMSKAALNMMSKSLALDLASDGILSAVIEPGWAKTDMGGPNAPTEVADSVRGVIAQYDGLALHNNGAYLSYRGGTMAW